MRLLRQLLPDLLVVAAIAAALVLLFALGCASPLAPTDPCAKPASPKGCTPPTCAHPMCY